MIIKNNKHNSKHSKRKVNSNFLTCFGFYVSIYINKISMKYKLICLTGVT